MRALPDSRLDLLTNGQGLTERDAAERRARFGENRIVSGKRSRWLGLAIDTSTDPMVWFLLATAAVYAWIGDIAEAVILVGALLPIAGMDAFLHWRTQASTEGLLDRLASRARVVREGRESEVAAIDLVPGDLVRVQAGEWIPADGLLVGGENLQTDESTLTGEAMPVLKRALGNDVLLRAGAKFDDPCWASAGTRLLTGAALIRIAFTGAETLYGQIVRSVQSGRTERTPLQQAIRALVAILVAVASAICVALAITRYLQGFGLLDAFLSAVTLAVAALPEEFPVVFTFFLGVGVFRLARRRALVRRAVAVENIGRVTCICSDKTGTLTEGRLRLEHVIPARGVEAPVLLGAAAAASRRESADPLDLCILDRVGESFADRLAVFPFSEDRRRETTVIRDSSGMRATVKGAPETVLALTVLDEPERAEWMQRTAQLAAAAHKVIACAALRLDAWRGDEPRSGYDFLGLLAFEDRPREGVADAVAAAQRAGIRVIMVTGDYQATARAIALELGIGRGDPVIIDGEALTSRVQNGAAEAVIGFDVVARATPSQKLALVQSLKRAGEIVAVTGDGVNDAPALRAADIGVAMGERGAQTSREVASIVLLDDNFRTIVRAIGEGQQLFRNLQLSFAYLLMAHAPLVVTAAAVPLMGEPLLYLPVHIVWLELIFHPTAILVFQYLPSGADLEPVDRSARPRFFTVRQSVIIALAAFLATALVLYAYHRALNAAHEAEQARSAALACLVLASAAIGAGLSRFKTRTSAIACGGAALSAIVFIQTPFLARLMHLAPLGAGDWLTAGLGAAVVGVCASVLAETLRTRSAVGPGRVLNAAC